MATFLTDMIRKGYTQDELFAVLFESKQEKERRWILTIVTKTVDAHRLKKIKEFLAYEKLATWRRLNGFDRVVEGENNWFDGHRSLPPTPEQYTASFRFELQKLKDAISMPAENPVTRPRQKTMDVVDGLRKDSLDELLANFEFARIKEYVEKRSREEVQAQVTVTPVDNVQHCSPCSSNPDMPSDVCVKLESSEGKMGPELEELESPSAGTGLETPGQQCPPNEGTWDQGRTTASGFLTAGVDSNQEGNISLLKTRLRQLQPRKTAGARHLAKRTSSSTPVEKERRQRLGTRLLLYFLFLGRAGRLLACASFVCVFCVLGFLNYCSFQVMNSQRAERHEGRHGSSH